jgi:hypothetical protein
MDWAGIQTFVIRWLWVCVGGLGWLFTIGSMGLFCTREASFLKGKKRTALHSLSPKTESIFITNIVGTDHIMYSDPMMGWLCSLYTSPALEAVANYWKYVSLGSFFHHQHVVRWVFRMLAWLSDPWIMGTYALLGWVAWGVSLGIAWITSVVYHLYHLRLLVLTPFSYEHNMRTTGHYSEYVDRPITWARIPMACVWIPLSLCVSVPVIAAWSWFTAWTETFRTTRFQIDPKNPHIHINWRTFMYENTLVHLWMGYWAIVFSSVGLSWGSFGILSGAIVLIAGVLVWMACRAPSTLPRWFANRYHAKDQQIRKQHGNNFPSALIVGNRESILAHGITPSTKHFVDRAS